MKWIMTLFFILSSVNVMAIDPILKAKADKYADDFGIERELFYAIIRQESNWNWKAYLWEKNVQDYSVGLTQIRYETAKGMGFTGNLEQLFDCLLYTSPSPRDRTRSRMPSSA